MIDIVKTYSVMLCLYKRLQCTKHLIGGWKGWKMISVSYINSAKWLEKNYRFNIFGCFFSSTVETHACAVGFEGLYV